MSAKYERTTRSRRQHTSDRRQRGRGRSNTSFLHSVDPPECIGAQIERTTPSVPHLTIPKAYLCKGGTTNDDRRRSTTTTKTATFRLPLSTFSTTPWTYQALFWTPPISVDVKYHGLTFMVNDYYYIYTTTTIFRQCSSTFSSIFWTHNGPFECTVTSVDKFDYAKRFSYKTGGTNNDRRRRRSWHSHYLYLLPASLFEHVQHHSEC